MAEKKKEKEVVFRLVKVTEIKGEDKETFSFLYQLDHALYGKDVRLVVKCSDPYETLGFLGLPQSVGDEVTVVLSTKSFQSSLESNKE